MRTVSLEMENFLTHFEFDRALSVRLCYVNLSRNGQIFRIFKVVELEFFFILLASSLTDI